MKDIYRCAVQHTNNTEQTIEDIPGLFIAVCTTVRQIVNIRSGLCGNAAGKLFSGSSPENLQCGIRKRFSLCLLYTSDAADD